MPENVFPERDRGADESAAPVTPARRKWTAGVFSVVMIAAVASPVAENWRAHPRDSFPLSYYPMFSEPRESAAITYIVGIDREGRRHRLHYRHAARGGMNQARKRISKLVGKGRAADLCGSVAAKVAAHRAGGLHAIVAIEIRTDRYRLREYFATRDRIPLSEKVHHTCTVKRPRE
jgi:hypothetical protein